MDYQKLFKQEVGSNMPYTDDVTEMIKEEVSIKEESFGAKYNLVNLSTKISKWL